MIHSPIGWTVAKKRDGFKVLDGEDIEIATVKLLVPHDDEIAIARKISKLAVRELTESYADTSKGNAVLMSLAPEAHEALVELSAFYKKYGPIIDRVLSFYQQKELAPILEKIAEVLKRAE